MPKRACPHGLAAWSLCPGRGARPPLLQDPLPQRPPARLCQSPEHFMQMETGPTTRTEGQDLLSGCGLARCVSASSHACACARGSVSKCGPGPGAVCGGRPGEAPSARPGHGGRHLPSPQAVSHFFKLIFFFKEENLQTFKALFLKGRDRDRVGPWPYRGGRRYWLRVCVCVTACRCVCEGVTGCVHPLSCPGDTLGRWTALIPHLTWWTGTTHTTTCKTLPAEL